MTYAPDRVFDRPVFVVGSPRSGASLVFDTLMRAPGVFTVGGESHRLIEGIPALDVRQRGYASNRLDAADAVGPVVQQLRDRLLESARDRDGAPPSSLPLRLLDKTPKNALRIPFLAAAFPQARFVYLYREPREVLANMLLAWSSGRFRTYVGLPGWPWRHWSLALTPGWRDLIGKPLADVVAGQWEAATALLLDDLEALDRSRWRVVRYADFVAKPSAETMRLCLALDFDWDRPLTGDLIGQLPPASAEDAETIRRHAADLQRLWPRLQPLAERAQRFADV